MRGQAPVVAVTGASGYLGSQICQTLESGGWQAIRLTRSPDQSRGQAFSHDLAMPITAQVRKALQSVDALIHAAYDLSLTSSADIWRVNVAGTRRLLEEARAAGLSSILKP
jgi:nucleoside-diphosphate-sugar epimerase